MIATDLALSIAVSQEQATIPFQYKVSNKRPIHNTSIQKISFNQINGMNKDGVRKVNAALMTTSAAFSSEAKQCGSAAQGRPWGYELTLEKVLLSRKYLSVVFAKSTVCAGSPDIEKEARVFSLPTGNLIPARSLLTQAYSKAKLVTSTSTNKDLIDLDEEMAETMLEHSKEILKNDDKRCDFYLKNSSYRLWTDGKNLILFPEYIQAQSFCQKEYVIHPED
ncbi:hypothetical protein [Massilia sp. CT11-137]|uniref:hypothetical protein n=1 Tax=Massilia sp. CT11-137 TaxID=3393901 RepID=UPI0039A51500